MANKSGKFILNIGDEGGILTYMQGKKVVRRLYAPTANYSDTGSFIELLQSDPKASISMLVDVMDQSYVQHSLPPVSSFSVNNLIKRKMERDFAEDDLKGALQLGREKEGRRDWKYLFVTLSRTPQINSWLDMVMEQPNHFVGIYLLPVEAENFMVRLRTSIKGKEKKAKKTELAPAASQWQLLVAHNKVGGFRQVVLRNGKLIFARLAQPIGDNQPEVVAGNIEQEISVTIEYLKRLGYNDEQGMDVYVIASEFIKNAVDSKNINVADVHLLSPHEAALKLGLDQVTEPNDQFADVLLAAAFNTAKKHTLKLQTKEQSKLNQLYSALLGVKVGGALFSVGAVIAAIYYAIAIPGAKEDIDRYESQTRRAEQQLEEVKQQEESLPDDLEKMTDLVALHQQLNDLGMQPSDSMQQFAGSLRGYDVFVDKVDWQLTNTVLSPDTSSNSRGGAAKNAENLTMKMTLHMYGTEVGSQEFDKKIGRYMEELEKLFPGYEVTLTSERPNAQQEATFEIGNIEDPIVKQPYFELEIEIKGTGVVDEKAAGGR
jgi:hypothetical protein